MYPSSQNVADGFVYYNATSSNVYVGDLNVLIDPNNPGAGSVGIPQLTDVPEDNLFATLDGVLQSSGLNYPTSGSEEVLEYITTTVSANTYCATVTYDPGTLYCVPHGTVINSSGNDVGCGDLYNETNFGDYWCPEGFRFDLASDTCILEQNICDVGPVLTASCNPTLFTTPANDTYFNAYDSGCVENIAAPGQLYDSTCCLAAVFNGVGLYQDNAGSDPDHIKVY